MTYRELAQRPRPFIAISATDISLGAQFVFSQAQFDPICSDIEQLQDRAERWPPPRPYRRS